MSLERKRLVIKAERMGLTPEELWRRMKLAELNINDVESLERSYGIPLRSLAEVLEELAYDTLRKPMCEKYATAIDEFKADKAVDRLPQELGLKGKDYVEVLETLKLSYQDIEARLKEYKAKGKNGRELGEDLLDEMEMLYYNPVTVRDGMAEMLASIAAKYQMSVDELCQEGEEDGIIDF